MSDTPNPAAKKAAKKAATKPSKKKFIVGRQPICEAGKNYAPGAEIKLSEKRAKALKGFIEE